jgi:hypothetical protein
VGVKMSLFNSLKKRLTNQFLAVIVYEDRCNIKQKIVKNSKLIHKEEFNFDIPSKDNLGGKVINFINSLQDEYDNTYIALFLNTPGQGIIPGCDENALEKFHVDHKNVKSICKDDRFLMYATLIDIKWADKLFVKSGLDFLFSPFLVLDYFIKKAMKQEYYNKDEVVLYMLNTHNALTLMIQKGDEFLYGAFFNIAKGEDLLYTDYDDIEDDTQMEELNLDDISDLEMEDILDVSNQSNFVTNILQSDENITEEDERIIKYLNSSLKEFYSNDLYHSEFITAAKIYDDVGLNEGVMKYIESELLLDTRAENISVNDVILDLSMQEASI